MKKPQSRVYSFILIGGSATILLVTPILVLMFGGYLLDLLFKTGKFFLILGALMGFTSGMINIFKLVKKLT